jgi:hypothetical protein
VSDARLGSIIPNAEQQGALAFKALSDDDVATLLSKLENAHPSLFLAQFVHRLDAPDRLASTLLPVVRFLLGLHLAGNNSRLGTDTFVERVAAELGALGDGQPVSPTRIEVLRRVLGMHASLGVTAKALSVMGRHDKPFHSAQVLTDVRSIFGGDATSNPEAAVVIHNLRIAYQRPLGPENVYIALDRRDVESMIDTLRRALDKETSIRRALGGQVEILDVPTVDG